MNFNDIISDMIIRIKNAQARKLMSTKCLHSNTTLSILNVLYEEGYIRGYKQLNFKELEIYLKYYLDKPVIENIKRVSKPGRRVYYSIKDILNTDSSELYILSTSKGILSSTKANRMKLGGEALFKIS